MDSHDISKADSAEGGGSAKRRSRAGCLTCRRRRVKCDEARPTCGKCAERSTSCEWPAAKVTSHHRHPRAIRSCESCRTRKTKCEIENGINGPCTSCINYGSECVWPRVESLPLDTLNDVHRQSIYDNPTGALPSPWPAEIQTDSLHANSCSRQDVIGLGNEDPALITELLRLYFGTVHYFGFLTFIHEADFWDRFEHGTVPEPLTLLMAANALRFGRGPNAIEQLHLADKWAAEAGKHVMGQAMLEFGAMELMMVVLYHHYEFQCGRYSRGWVLAGMAVRMMTFLRLHMFDEFPHHINKPMLDGESLRRLAWSVYYLDATMDGGHHGFTAIPDGAFTIPLPCDEKPFLRHQPTSKEYMLPSDASAPSSDLGLAGYLLRAMYARQILAGLHSRIQRQLVPISMIPTYVKQAESDARQLLGVLPPDLEDSKINFHIWKGQQTIFLHLHVLRNTCLRHLALLKILCAPHLGDDDVSTQRDQLVYEASQMSGLFSLSLDRGIVLDPQMAMHAYNGLEILLYQPLRRRPDSPSPPPSRAEISTLILPFLKVLRDVAEVSELVSLLYPEAVNRMVRVGYTEHLSDEDMLALLRRVHRLANPDSEFDFHDSFWRYEVAVSRLKGDGGDPVSPNDLLLEVRDHAGPSKKTTGGEEQASALSRLQAVFGPSQSRQNACNEAWRTSADVPAYILPVENLETLIGGTRQPGQMGIPLDWSLSGIDL